MTVAQTEEAKQFELNRDVLVPPTPEMIDEHIQNYENAKTAFDLAKAVVDTEKDKLVFLADHFGHRAPGAEQSVRLTGTRNAAMVTRGTSVVIDENAVASFKKSLRAPRLFVMFFATQTTHKLLKGATDRLKAASMSPRRYEKLVGLYVRCFDVKTNAPSLKVEVIKPEKPSTKTRAQKAVA